LIVTPIEINALFDLPAFLDRIEEAASRQQVLQLLKELEPYCIHMHPDECRQVSVQVAERMSSRMAQLQ
jgi:hypothetical protein